MCATETTRPGQVPVTNLDADLDLLDSLRFRGLIAVDAHRRLVKALLLTDPTASTAPLLLSGLHRERRQTGTTTVEAKCTNLKEDLWKDAFGDFYAGQQNCVFLASQSLSMTPCNEVQYSSDQ